MHDRTHIPRAFYLQKLGVTTESGGDQRAALPRTMSEKDVEDVAIV